MTCNQPLTRSLDYNILIFLFEALEFGVVQILSVCLYFSVRLGDFISSLAPLSCGVLQIFILGPVLFSLHASLRIHFQEVWHLISLLPTLTTNETYVGIIQTLPNTLGTECCCSSANRNAQARTYYTNIGLALLASCSFYILDLVFNQLKELAPRNPSDLIQPHAASRPLC